MMKRRLLIISLFALLLTFVGCEDDGAGEAVAEVGSSTVTIDDVNTVVASLGQQGQRMAADAEGRRQIIERAISDELVYQAALLEGIDELPEVRSRIDQAVRNIVIGYYLQTTFSDLGFSEEEIEVFYNANQDEFQRPAQAYIRHLQLDERGDADKARERLEAGEDFAEVAEAYGIDPRTTQQLVLSSNSANAPYELVEAVFAARAGDLVGPLELDDGYHLVFIQDMRAAQPMLLEESRQQVIEAMLVSEEDARHYFEQNRELFDRPPSVAVRFIIVDNEQRASEVRSRLAGGADFAETAVEESIDPVYGPRGGLVERFYQGSQLNGFQQEADLRAFTETVFSLETGELSKTVQLERGWLIALVEERFPAKETDYNEVSSQVHEMLLQERLMEREDSFLTELEGEVGIEKNQELIDLWVETGQFYSAETSLPGEELSAPADTEVDDSDEN